MAGVLACVIHDDQLRIPLGRSDQLPLAIMKHFWHTQEPRGKHGENSGHGCGSCNSGIVQHIEQSGVLHADVGICPVHQLTKRRL